jgi:hypothetical protein
MEDSRRVAHLAHVTHAPSGGLLILWGGSVRRGPVHRFHPSTIETPDLVVDRMSSNAGRQCPPLLHRLVRRYYCNRLGNDRVASEAAKIITIQKWNGLVHVGLLMSCGNKLTQLSPVFIDLDQTYPQVVLCPKHSRRPCARASHSAGVLVGGRFGLPCPGTFCTSGPKGRRRADAICITRQCRVRHGLCAGR